VNENKPCCESANLAQILRLLQEKSTVL